MMMLSLVPRTCRVCVEYDGEKTKFAKGLGAMKPDIATQNLLREEHIG